MGSNEQRRIHTPSQRNSVKMMKATESSRVVRVGVFRWWLFDHSETKPNRVVFLGDFGYL